MAQNGGIEMIITLLNSPSDQVQRQAAKALANLGVNSIIKFYILYICLDDNKELITKAGGLPPLIAAAKSENVGVEIEAIAALANLAVNDVNEVEIGKLGGIEPIIEVCKKPNLDLQSQAARALRNLSVNKENQKKIISLGGVETLKSLLSSTNEKVMQQAKRALSNLEQSLPDQEEKKS